MVSNKHADATGSAGRRAAGGARTLTAGPGPFGGLGRAVVRHPWAWWPGHAAEPQAPAGELTREAAH